MLIDLFSANNYGTFNICLAQKLGLECSVYISALIDYMRFEMEDSSIDCENTRVFIPRDFDFIKKRTTFDKDKQKQLDAYLIELGFLKFHETDKNLFSLDLQILMSLVVSDKESIIKEVKKFQTKKRTKVDMIKTELKSYITSTNAELRDAYSDWIDAVFSRQGWMSKKSVVNGQQLIDTYCNHDLDFALEILKIASIGGYRDIQWAINEYEKNKRSFSNQNKTNTINPNKQKEQLPVQTRCLDISGDIF